MVVVVVCFGSWLCAVVGRGLGLFGLNVGRGRLFSWSDAQRVVQETEERRGGGSVEMSQGSWIPASRGRTGLWGWLGTELSCNQRPLTAVGRVLLLNFAL